MKKVASIILAVTLLSAVALSQINHWPRGLVKDLTWLWLKETSIDEIIIALDKTPYARVWLLNGQIQNVSIRNDKGRMQNVTDYNVEEVISIAEEMGMKNAFFFKNNLGWSIDGSLIDSWRFSHYQTQDDMSVQVNYAYHLKISDDMKLCSKELIEQNEVGRCYVNTISKWIPVKTWVASNHSHPIF